MKFSIDWLPQPPRDHRRQCLCCIRVSTASKHQNAIPRQRARSPAIRVAARSVSSPMAPLLLRIFCAGLLQVGVVAKALTRRCWLRGDLRRIDRFIFNQYNQTQLHGGSRLMCNNWSRKWLKSTLHIEWITLANELSCAFVLASRKKLQPELTASSSHLFKLV